MNKLHFPLLLVLLTTQVATAQNQWTWVSGEKSANVKGVYGTKGVAAPSNRPGSRIGASVWTDSKGKIWLFGGHGNSESGRTGRLNDLWKYDPSSNLWTWIGGSKQIDDAGNYESKGRPSPKSQPGARLNAVFWSDNHGNLWLFGGSGFAEKKDSEGLLNDLWKYSPVSNQWTWVNGSDKVDQGGKKKKRGANSPTDDDDDDDDDDNYPGARYLSVSWKDAASNLWMFGGRGYTPESKAGDLNEIWKYSITANTWTLVKGEGAEWAQVHYGQRGEFGETLTPGARHGSAGWTDKDGNFWLYGGRHGNDLFSDLWKYNPRSNQWAWISGSNQSNQQPSFKEKGIADSESHPGSRMLASGITGNDGDLWLFGGSGYGALLGPAPLNSLWKYSLSNNAWTFLNGEESIYPKAVYGTRNIPDSANQPGGAANSVSWKDQQGNLWIFGGQSLLGYLNQTWKYSITCPAGLLGSITPASASICKGGSQVLTASGGNRYEWQRNGVTIAGETRSTLTVTQEGTYTVLVTKGKCTAPASNKAVVTLVTAPKGNISPAAAAICEGSAQVLTATGGTSYEWKKDGVTITGQTSASITVKDAGTYSVIITNGNCSGPASNTAVITKESAPAGTINPSNVALCNGISQVLTATGGQSYEWLLNGIKIPGESSATLTVSEPGTYSVLVKGSTCSGLASNTALVTIADGSGTRYPDVTVLANIPAQLSARNIGTTYEWTPATGISDPSSANPTVTTSADREYLVRITTEQNCSVTDTILVKVTAEKKIFVPTAFTPNSNNVNDRLRPLGNLATLEYFRVYNRWGNLMFQTSEIGEGWDGRYKGVMQPSDSYTWLLSGTTLDGQPVKQSGKTLLIR